MSSGLIFWIVKLKCRHVGNYRFYLSIKYIQQNVSPHPWYFAMKSIKDLNFCLNSCTVISWWRIHVCSGRNNFRVSSQIGLQVNVINTAGRPLTRTKGIAFRMYSYIWRGLPVYEDRSIKTFPISLIFGFPSILLLIASCKRIYIFARKYNTSRSFVFYFCGHIHNVRRNNWRHIKYNCLQFIGSLIDMINNSSRLHFYLFLRLSLKYNQFLLFKLKKKWKIYSCYWILLFITDLITVFTLSKYYQIL